MRGDHFHFSFDPVPAEHYLDLTLPAKDAKINQFRWICGPKFGSMKIIQKGRDFAVKQNTTADTFFSAQEADKAMAEMSQRFFQTGGEIYLPDNE